MTIPSESDRIIERYVPGMFIFDGGEEPLPEGLSKPGKDAAKGEDKDAAEADTEE